MSFPLTPILDTFNRADAADLGANWTGGVWTGEPSPALTSNQMDGAGARSGYWNPTQFGPDMECFATYIAGNVWIDFCIQAIGGSLTCYEAFFSQSAKTVKFKSVVAGATVTNNIVTGNTLTFASGDVIGVRKVGSTLSAWHNGALIVQANNTDVTGSGWIGVETGGTTLDIFGGGTLQGFRYVRRASVG